MTTELPPEMKAMKAAMDAVFQAMVPEDESLPQTSKRQIDIESAILNVAPFDYLTASEIFAALERRLELRYEAGLNPKIEEAMQELSKAFDHITG